MPESRKRTRDEDEDIQWETRSLNHKRIRPLPFRTSPNAQHINTFSQSIRAPPPLLLTPALTPVETSEDEAEAKNPFRSPVRPKSKQLTMSSSIHIEELMDMDVDMDTDCSQPTLSPHPRQSVESTQPSPCTITPKSFFYNPQEVNSGGRIPTPIYGHFNPVDRRIEDESENNDPKTQQEIAHDIFLRRRRLPTPISEDEPMDDPDGMGDMLGRLDMGTKAAPTVPFRTNRMWGGEAATPSKGKLTLSMGYRADCEKCKLKVPGHYSHFISA
ncbi:MAG: hypothetical protein Q9194_004657 [Teloschistes cf. exilis]